MTILIDAFVAGSVGWTVYSIVRWIGDTWARGAEALNDRS